MRRAWCLSTNVLGRMRPGLSRLISIWTNFKFQILSNFFSKFNNISIIFDDWICLKFHWKRTLSFFWKAKTSEWKKVWKIKTNLSAKQYLIHFRNLISNDFLRKINSNFCIISNKVRLFFTRTSLLWQFKHIK